MDHCILWCCVVERIGRYWRLMVKDIHVKLSERAAASLAAVEKDTRLSRKAIFEALLEGLTAQELHRRITRHGKERG